MRSTVINRARPLVQILLPACIAAIFFLVVFAILYLFLWLLVYDYFFRDGTYIRENVKKSTHECPVSDITFTIFHGVEQCVLVLENVKISMIVSQNNYKSLLSVRIRRINSQCKERTENCPVLHGFITGVPCRILVICC